MITTSRYASLFTKNFAKSFSKLLNSNYFSRGKKTIFDLVEFSRKLGDQNVFVIKEKSGKPSSIDVVEVEENLEWHWLDSIGISYEE